MDLLSQSDITFDQIAARARLIWEQSGRLDGYDLENWLRAERDLRAEHVLAHDGAQPASDQKASVGQTTDRPPRLARPQRPRK